MRRLAFVLLLASTLRADGGQVLARGESGPFEITLFASPVPLTAGTADFSVLVQKKGSTDVVLDAEVTMRLQAAGLHLTHEAAQNQLLYAVQTNIPRAGAWTCEVTVSRAGELGRLGCAFSAGAPAAGISSYSFYFALPAVCVLLFLLNRKLAKR
jgi:hypothetical protein